MQKLLFIEFNELSSVVIDQLIANGELPNFQRFRNDSAVYTTQADESGYDLEPWIQWVSVHTGLPLSEHKARNLGDNQSLLHSTIGQCLSDSGIPVGIFGSMNLRHENVVGYCIPDPWDPEGQTEPKYLQRYYDVVSAQVKGSSGPTRTSVSTFANLAFFLLANGVRIGTIAYAVRQLALEVLRPELKWRRATVLDRLNYDIALRLNRKINPQFATFFSNSTAHFQHYYWQNLEPELFPNRTDINTAPQSNAILFGYRNMDTLLGQFINDYPDTTLVLITALSQEPWTTAQKQTYKPIDFARFFEFAGIETSGLQVKPIMAEEFRLEPADKNRLNEIVTALQSLTVDSKPLMKMQRYDNSLVVGCAIDSELSQNPYCFGHDGEKIRFKDMFSPVHGKRSGKHNPNGILWIRNFHHTVHEEPISLYDIAPATLGFFGKKAPNQTNESTLAFS